MQGGGSEALMKAYGSVRRRMDQVLQRRRCCSFIGRNKVTLPSGQVIDYLIDGQAQRVVKKVDGIIKQKFMYGSNGNIAVELNVDNTVKSIFIYGTESHSPDYMIQGAVRYRLVKDHLGSVRFVINGSNGNVAQSLAYDEFGKVLEDTNPGFQPFGFAGGLYDSDTKLVRFGARDYSSEIGRWISKDPILFRGGDNNLYGYVDNDPLNYVDPSGLVKCTYSIGSETLICTSNDGLQTISLNAFAGSTGVDTDPASTSLSGGPLPMDTYSITKVPGSKEHDWFLDPGRFKRAMYRAFGNLSPFRGGFNLHLRSGGSNGCIVAPPNLNIGPSLPAFLEQMLIRENGANTLNVTQ